MLVAEGYPNLWRTFKAGMIKVVDALLYPSNDTEAANFRRGGGRDGRPPGEGGGGLNNLLQQLQGRSQNVQPAFG
jgi:hypothetical protein